MRTCSKCKMSKDTSEYCRDRTKPSGLATECKSCRYIVTRAYREANPDKVKAIHKAEYYNNVEKKKSIQKAYREANPDKVRATNKAYYEKHSEKLTDRNRFRAFMSPDILKRDEYKCVLCPSKNKLNAHHIIPWSVSIEDRFNEKNVVTLCKECHEKAHNNKKWVTINESIALQLTVIANEIFSKGNK